MAGYRKVLLFPRFKCKFLFNFAENVISRSLEMILNMNFMKYCDNGSPSRSKFTLKTRFLVIFGTCCTSDGEPLLQCFIKFLLRIISRLLDITFLPSWTKLFTKTFKKCNCLIWPFSLHCPPKCIETIGVLGTRQITLICLETYFLDLYHKLTW